jgi:RNA polymerase sigma-70 factor (ECF subfamily)
MTDRDAASMGSSLPVEAELVARTKRGDDDAFAELVRMYQNRVFNFVLARVRHRQQAEDVTQEVLVKAYFSLGKLREPGKFKSWIFSIAHNHLRDLLRKRKLEIADVEEGYTEHYVDPSTPESELKRQRAQEDAWNALAKLKPEQREILVLCDIEGLSYREIAEIMRVPLGTVQSRIFYARRKLRGILAGEFAYKGDES